MLKNLFLSFAIVGSALLLAGCSGGGGGGAPAEKKYDRKTQWGTDDGIGEGALFENLEKDDVIASEFLGKRYDRADLEAIEKATVMSTAEYVTRLGVKMFKIVAPRDQDEEEDDEVEKAPKVYPFAFLPKASADLREEFKQRAGGNPLFKSLYLELSPPGRVPGNPHIILMDDAPRWYLLAEQMKHNFLKERLSQPSLPTAQTVFNKLETLKYQMEKVKQEYKQQPNLRDLTQIGKLAESFYKLKILDYSEYSQFENIAIHGLLIDSWLAGRLTHIKPVELGYALTVMQIYKNRAREELADEKVEEMLLFVLNESQRTDRDWKSAGDIVRAIPTLIDQVDSTTKAIVSDRYNKVMEKISTVDKSILVDRLAQQTGSSNP